MTDDELRALFTDSFVTNDGTQITGLFNRPFVQEALLNALRRVASSLAPEGMRTAWVPASERLPDKDGRLWAILTESRSNGKPGPWIPGFEYYHFIDGWATDQYVRYWLDAELHPLPKMWSDTPPPQE